MKRLACYFPLIAIGLEIAWVILIFLGYIFTGGDANHANNATGNRLLNLVAMLPILCGLVVGIVALAARFPGRRLEWIILIIGTFACALLTAWLAIGLAD